MEAAAERRLHLPLCSKESNTELDCALGSVDWAECPGFCVDWGVWAGLFALGCDLGGAD